MTRYLNSTSSSEIPPVPLTTTIRTNPRVKAILWSLVIGTALLAFVGLLVSHLL